MSNIRFQNALKRTPQAIPPVWFMRQAGRYHQHYQNLKKSHTFEELCKQPDLAAETAMGPMRDFDFDLAILFSDILFPLEALGMGLKYDPAPQLSFQLNESNIATLKRGREAADFMTFQKEAMIQTRAALPQNKSLIGFVGGPLTLFGYAVEGSHKGALKQTKIEVSLYKKFEEIILPFLIQNIQLQLDGGAEVVMVFDTTAGEFSPSFYQRHFLQTLRALIQKFPGRLGYYSKGTTLDHLMNPVFTEESWAGMGVDHRFNLPQLLIEKRWPGFLQGNFDQSLLFLETPLFKQELESYLKAFRDLTVEQRAGWVSGLGHGVLPQTPEAHVKYFVQRVREFFGE